jgi:hypothetical protein
MMEAIRAHVAAGKAIVGIRTASHAFELRGQPNPAGTTWTEFDTDVLGADYQDHYGKGPGRETLVRQITETHRGSVWAENRMIDGQIAGARFVVELPPALLDI